VEDLIEDFLREYTDYDLLINFINGQVITVTNSVSIVL